MADVKKVNAGRAGGIRRQALLRESKAGIVRCRHCDEPIYRPLNKYWAHINSGLKKCTAIMEAKPTLSNKDLLEIERFQIQRRNHPVPEDAWLYVAEIERLLDYIRRELL